MWDLLDGAQGCAGVDGPGPIEFRPEGRHGVILGLVGHVCQLRDQRAGESLGVEDDRVQAVEQPSGLLGQGRQADLVRQGPGQDVRVGGSLGTLRGADGLLDLRRPGLELLPLGAGFFAALVRCGPCYCACLPLKKVRTAMARVSSDRLEGMEGVDQTYVEGTGEGNRGRQWVIRRLVLVAVSLDGDGMGRTRLRHGADAAGRSFGESVRDCVELGSTVHTDGRSGCAGPERAGYAQQVTSTRGDDAITAVKFPRVRLVASLLKRWLTGTH